MRKLAIYNNKGGVAKTTSVINLAYSLQKAGRKVLVVDCDSQENCFSFFLLESSPESILPTEYANLCHTTWERFAEISEEERAKFDHILFDLPPAMTDEVRKILHYSGTVYVPTMLGEFEISGLQKVTLEIAHQNARLGGIFVTMYQKENDEELLADFKSVLQAQLMKTVIPFSRTVRESQKAGIPIAEYFAVRNVPRIGNSWKIVTAYDSLAEEIMKGSGGNEA